MAQMYTIRVHAISLSDDDGKRANTVTKESFQEALEQVTEIFSLPTYASPSIRKRTGSRATTRC